MLSPLKSCSLIFRGLLLLLWMGVIFSFSSLWGSAYPYDPPFSYYLERKGAHVFEYAVLMLLTVWFAATLFSRETWRGILLLSGVFALTYGVTDELHQFFVPYREGKMSDVLIDGVGILLAGLCIFLVLPTRKQSK